MHQLVPAAGYRVERLRRRHPRDAAHDHTAIRGMIDQAFGFESAEGFAHRGLGDAPVCCDIFLAEVFAHRDVPGHDTDLEGVVDCIRLRLAGRALNRHPTIIHGGR